MKIILEGTAEQIKNLNLLIDEGNNDLPKINESYQIENLWSVSDMQDWDCTDDEALEVLEQALTNDATMEQIWFAIDYHARYNGLKHSTKNK
jgi:hypothetical protein|tara:strand:+ start:700 stop:975 length:276 start_codon:yes stop_codon:yes gene_type:complete